MYLRIINLTRGERRYKYLKLRVSEWAPTQAIHEIFPREIPLHHYYRSLDYLITHKESLEEDIFWNVNDIFNLDLSLVFYDLTSSYFEGECCDIAKRGYSRDHRRDCRQRIRPIYHYKDMRVRGHVFICVLAYLLEKFMDKKLKQAHLPMSPQKALHKLKSIRIVNYTVMNKHVQKRTDISPEQESIFNALSVSDIPRIPIF